MTQEVNQSKKIYYRPANAWIEVSEEQKRDWDRFVGTIRKSKQRAGECYITYKESYKCDGICDNCKYRLTSENKPNPLSIDMEMDMASENGISHNSLLIDDALTTSINVESIILKSLFDELKEKDYESYQILMLVAEGLSERECARQMNMPRNTFVYKKKKLFEVLKEKIK